MRPHEIIAQVKQAIRSPYAWPGGYPVYTVMADGELLCCACAKSEFRQIVRATYQHSRDGWAAMGSAVHWKGPDEYCAHCNKTLESAYGDTEQN